MDVSPATQKAGAAASVCRYCSSDLGPSADYCLKCERFQSWSDLCTNCGQAIPQGAHWCTACASFQSNRHCRACAVPIPIHAKVCHQCKSPQFLGGYLTLGQTTLALLISLISVAGALFPQIKSVFLWPSSKTRVTIEEVNAQHHLVLWAANDGSESSYLKSARLEVKGDPKANKNLVFVQPGEGPTAVQKLRERKLKPGKEGEFHLVAPDLWRGTDFGFKNNGTSYEDASMEWRRALGDRQLHLVIEVDGVRENPERKLSSEFLRLFLWRYSS